MSLTKKHEDKQKQWSKNPERDRDLDNRAIDSYVANTLRDLALVLETRARHRTHEDAHPLQRDERLAG